MIVTERTPVTPQSIGQQFSQLNACDWIENRLHWHKSIIRFDHADAFNLNLSLFDIEVIF